MLIDREVDVDLTELVERVAKDQPLPVSAEAQASILDFVGGRLQAWLQDQGWAADVLAAVLAEQSTNPYRALVAVRELNDWVQRSDWETILDNFARCVRITRSEADDYMINPDALVEAQEKALYAAYQTASTGLNGNVSAFLDAFVPMIPAVTEFFDNVLVNAEDEVLRRNRLALLQAISSLQAGRADLSHLSGF